MIVTMYHGNILEKNKQMKRKYTKPLVVRSYKRGPRGPYQTKNITPEEELKETFMGYVDKTAPNDCWLWTGSKNNAGFGMFRYRKKMRTAHRVSAEWAGLTITNTCVLHSCSVYLCVNPKHLYTGNRKDLWVKTRAMGRAGHGMRGHKHKSSTCLHCGYHGCNTVIGRLHNDKCKHKI